VPEESVWDCVTCGACVQACPVSIEHIDHIVDLRRHLVMVESSFPSEAEPMLRDIERSSNPWGHPQAQRADWAAGLDVRVLEPGDAPPEYLYWVGCASSFDDRARRTAQSTAKLLRAAGVAAHEGPLADEVRRTNRHLILKRAAEDIAVISPVKKTMKRSPIKKKSAADMDAFWSAFGAWKDVDTERLKADNYESRRLSTKPRPEL